MCDSRGKDSIGITITIGSENPQHKTRLATNTTTTPGDAVTEVAVMWAMILLNMSQSKVVETRTNTCSKIGWDQGPGLQGYANTP